MIDESMHADYSIWMLGCKDTEEQHPRLNTPARKLQLQGAHIRALYCDDDSWESCVTKMIRRAGKRPAGQAGRGMVRVGLACGVDGVRPLRLRSGDRRARA